MRRCFSGLHYGDKRRKLMDYSCVGFLEIATIAKGIQVADALLKKASIYILFAYPVSSGKYLICLTGEVEDVRSSLNAGKETAGAALVDHFLLPNIHPTILPALQEAIEPGKLDALGILETVTCAGCIVAVDCALKTSRVRLVKIHLAKGIAGKAYFVIEGNTDNVESAIAASIRAIQRQGIVEKVIIPQAADGILKIL